MNIERCICKYGNKELVLTGCITHLKNLAPENEAKITAIPNLGLVKSYSAQSN